LLGLPRGYRGAGGVCGMAEPAGGVLMAGVELVAPVAGGIAADEVSGVVGLAGGMAAMAGGVAAAGAVAEALVAAPVWALAVSALKAQLPWARWRVDACRYWSSFE
jgi:hypothetical protein